MKVISCFSYKGGAGRTTAAANIAAALSSQVENVGAIELPLSCKVALIDLDVFSAGTHRVFEIDNTQLKAHKPCIQDYLREQISPSAYIKNGGISLKHDYMQRFRRRRFGEGNCHPEFLLLPAKPEPGEGFHVQKLHENVLIELLMELESKNQGFDYVILDAESGGRSMANIAMRLADVILMFFRLTWQHIDGTLNYAREFPHKKPFYLIPACVPLVQGAESIYRSDAPGLTELSQLTQMIPDQSGLDKFVQENRSGAGYFWAGNNGVAGRLCIHDSLFLKGEERIIVFEARQEDRAAKDFYTIAAEINKLHPPTG